MENYFEYSFKFGISEIFLLTKKSIGKSSINDIVFLINFLQDELDRYKIDSRIKEFNLAQANIPIKVSTEFLEFLQYNLDIYQIHPEICPFTFDEDFEGQFCEMDLESTSAVKLVKFTLDPSYFSKYFIIQKLLDYLFEKKITNYLLIYENIRASFGEVKTNTHFTIDQSKTVFQFQLENQVALLELADTQSDKPKFGAKIEPFNLTYIILMGENLLRLKDLSLEAATLPSPAYFKEFTRKNEIGIFGVSDTDEILDFN